MHAENDLMLFDNSLIINVKFGGYATVYSGNDVYKIYGPGKYLNLFKRRYTIDYEGDFFFSIQEIDIILSYYPKLADFLIIFELKEDEIAVLIIDGFYINNFSKPGKQAIWKPVHRYEFKIYSTKNLIIEDKKLLPYAAKEYISFPSKKYEVLPNKNMIVYVNRKAYKILTPGIYYFWTTPGKKLHFEVIPLVSGYLYDEKTFTTKDKIDLVFIFYITYSISDFDKYLLTNNLGNILDMKYIISMAIGNYVTSKTFNELCDIKETSENILSYIKGELAKSGISVCYGGVATLNLIDKQTEILLNKNILSDNKIFRKLAVMDFLENFAESVNKMSVEPEDIMQYLYKITGNIDDESVYEADNCNVVSQTNDV